MSLSLYIWFTLQYLFLLGLFTDFYLFLDSIWYFKYVYIKYIFSVLTELVCQMLIEMFFKKRSTGGAKMTFVQGRLVGQELVANVSIIVLVSFSVIKF